MTLKHLFTNIEMFLLASSGFCLIGLTSFLWPICRGQ